MTDRKALTPEELDEILASLDQVMEDARVLRRSISQQLADARANDRQELSAASNRRRRPRPRAN